MEIRFNWFDDRKARLQRAFEEIGYRDESDLDREIAESAGTLNLEETDFSSDLGIDESFLFKPENDAYFTFFVQMNPLEEITSELIASTIDNSNLDPQVIDSLFKDYEKEVAEPLDAIQEEILSHVCEEITVNPYANVSPELYSLIADQVVEKKGDSISKEDSWQWN